MYFINALSLDLQGRINLSKFFSYGSRVSTFYDDENNWFELFNSSHYEPIEQANPFVQESVVDRKGRIHLPIWVRKMANTKTFLVAVKVYPSIHGDTYSAILKPVNILTTTEEIPPDIEDDN